MAQCPHLIYVDTTAFGHVGPLSDKPGYELLMQASAGLMSVTGGEDAPPTRAGPSIVDLTTGMWIAIGALAATVRRSRDGKGCVVNASLYESALALSAIHIANFSVTGEMPARTANGFPGLAPYGGFKARDEDIIVGAGNDGLFVRLAHLLGRPEWTTDERVSNKRELDTMINQALAVDDAQTWLARLEAAGIPCAPIRGIPDVVDHAQTVALDIVASSDADPALRVLRSPLSFDGRRPTINSSAPAPGQDDEQFP
jgi:formyl-CoA transferase